MNRKCGLSLRAERAQLRFCREPADLLLAQSPLVALVRDPDGVDATGDDHGDRFQRGAIVRQQPAASAQLADGEGETWLIGRRYRDPRGSWLRERIAGSTVHERRRFIPADHNGAQRAILGDDVHSRQVTNVAFSAGPSCSETMDNRVGTVSQFCDARAMAARNDG